MLKTILKNSYNLKTDIDELEPNLEIYAGSNCKLLENSTHAVGLIDIPGDFGPEELADVVDTAERLYEAIGKPVYLCLGMGPEGRVLVREMPIKSKADFTIQLAIIDPVRTALEAIRKRVESGTAGDEEKEALEIMPMLVPTSMRSSVRAECFKLLSAF